MSNEGTSHVLQSLLVNLSIAVAKGFAAFVTGSGALLAETIHSTADCSNQILLLVGIRAAARPPTPEHPLGHGRNLYFWSFMVALLLFSLGGMFSIYEGIHKIAHPEPIERPAVGFAILLFSLALEGWATWSNVREMRRRKGSAPLFAYLRETKDSDLIVVFGENSAAVCGLLLALAALGLAVQTGDARWDAAGSVGVGAVLVAVAIFLASEVKSLLVGERADAHVEHAVRALAGPDRPVREILSAITIQQGPGEVMLACKVRLADDLTTAEVVSAINAFERDVRARCPEVRWQFVEPDIEA